MRARPGIRSQLSFVPQSPNGPAALSLAGPYYFQPDMRIFLDEEGSQRAEEAALHLFCDHRVPKYARLTDQSIASIVKAHAARIGLDPAAFAGHSLRSWPLPPHPEFVVDPG